MAGSAIEAMTSTNSPPADAVNGGLSGGKKSSTAHCSGSEPMRTWPHERLLRRPQRKDSLLGRKRRHVQGPGGSHLLRLALLSQTLRRQGQKGRIAGSEEEARIYSQARRKGEEPPCRRS